MPVLKNHKHEAFAQAVAKGSTADEAYVTAGYKESRSAASRLSANVNIQARSAELQAKGAERAEIDIARVLKEIGRLSTSDIRAAFDADGRVKPPEEWSDDFAAAVSSVEVVTRNVGEGQVEHVYKLKMWCKNSALDKLARHFPVYNDRLSLTVTDGLAERLARARARGCESLAPIEAAALPRGDDIAAADQGEVDDPDDEEPVEEAGVAVSSPRAHTPILPRKKPVPRPLAWPDMPGKTDFEYNPYSRQRD